MAPRCPTCAGPPAPPPLAPPPSAPPPLAPPPFAPPVGDTLDGRAHDVRRPHRRVRPRSPHQAYRRRGVGAAQQGAERGGVRSRGGVNHQAGLHRRDQRAGCGRCQQAEGGPLAGPGRVEHVVGAGPVVGRAPGQQVMAERSQRPHVRRGVGVAARCDRRVEVLRRPVDPRRVLAGRSCHAEVGKQRHAVGGEQHVGRGDVAVHHPEPVRNGQRRGQGRGDRDDLTGVEHAPAGQQGGQRPTRRVVEHQDVTDDGAQPHDVRRVEPAQQRGLPAQQLQSHRVGARPQPLQGHHVTGGELACPPDLAGGAEAQHRLDVVPRHLPHLVHGWQPTLPRPAVRVVHT